jgi:hypothetical protein
MQIIVQGGQSTLNVRLNYSQNGVQGDPIDLTGIYDIKSCFMNADGSELMLSLLTSGITILGSPTLGKIAIALTAAQSALLQLVDSATLEVDLIQTSGADPVKIQIPQGYSVVQSVC